MHDTGQTMVELEDIRGDWARPSYHLGAQSVGFFEDGDLVAYSEVGWIDQIAVRRDARGRGLGRALLVAAFTAAREHGATISRLNTDSRIGALGLYEHVGMVVVETYQHYAVSLT